MPTVKLTDRFIDSLKPANSGDYFDTLEPGLALRAGARKKVFSLAYSRPGTRNRTRIKLGQYSDRFGIAKARRKARELKSQVEVGIDPQEAIALPEGMKTVEDLIETYIVKHASSLKSGKEVERRLRFNALDENHGIGSIRLADYRRQHIVGVVDAVAGRGATTEAVRCFEDLRAVSRWAVNQGILEFDITSGMKAPYRVAARDRVLSKGEIKAFFDEVEESGIRPVIQDVLHLIFETACRVSEIAGLTREEVNLNDMLLELPADRVKNATAHKVPLTEKAADIVEKAIKNTNQSYLFTAKDKPVRGDVVANGIAKAQKRGGFSFNGWTAHDIRRTWATLASESGVPPHVIAASLNHKSVNSSVTFASYIRHDYLPERRVVHQEMSNKFSEIAALK